MPRMKTRALLARTFPGICLVIALGAVAQPTGSAQVRPAPVVEGHAIGRAPESRGEAAQAIDAALAAALIGAVAAQFDERGVEVKLERVLADPENLVDIRVDGQGRMRIGDQPEWLPVRVQGLYDSVALSVDQPRITIGGDAPGEELAATSPVGRSLQQLAGERLQREFVQQPVALRLDTLTRSSAGSRYARVDARGTARFDDGTAPVSVHGLYDVRTGRWLRIAYELAGNAPADVDPPPGVATGP